MNEVGPELNEAQLRAQHNALLAKWEVDKAALVRAAQALNREMDEDDQEIAQAILDEYDVEDVGAVASFDEAFLWCHGEEPAADDAEVDEEGDGDDEMFAPMDTE